MNNQFIIFDGNCGFCNKTIMFIAKNDIKNNFTFISSASDFGKTLLVQHNIKGLEKSTLILLENETHIYTKSTAVKKIFQKIPYYKIISYIMFFFPKKISDYIYSFISKKRTHIIKNATCEIPNLELKKKFVL